MEIVARSIDEILKLIPKHFHDFSKFGLWFRGQEDFSFDLTPSLFRQGVKYKIKTLYEKAMFRDFLLLKHVQDRKSLSTFEFLTIMQHYRMPTRLLDWTSNLLVALFFAVQNHKKDGALFILDPCQLNRISSWNNQDGMYDYLTNEVVIRSNLARIDEDLSELLNVPEIVNIISKSRTKMDLTMQSEGVFLKFNSKEWQRTVETPIAVVPAQQHDRILLQSGKFTLHGGKMFAGENVVISRSIEECIQNTSGILIKIKIPRRSKLKISNALSYCGINESSLFPELDYQASYIVQKWTNSNDKSK